MTRLAPLLGALLAAGALGWWLLRGDTSPAPPDPLEQQETVEGGAAGLAGRAAPAAVEATPAENPYAEVDDLRILARFLGERERTQNAQSRLASLIGDDAERLRALLRELHPTVGNGTLANYHTKGAVTALVLGVGDPALDVLLAELDDENAIWRTQMDMLIGSFQSLAERAVPRLLQQLGDVPEDPPAAEAASVLYALGAIGPAAKEVLPDVHRWLDEGVTQHVEVASAHALVQIGGASEETFERCKEVLREVNWPNQRGAVLAELGALGERAVPMIPYLLELVREGVLDEWSALKSLGAMGVADERVLAYVSQRFLAADNFEQAAGSYGGTLARLGDEGLERLFELSAQRGGMVLAHLPLAFPTHAFPGAKSPPPWQRVFATMEPAFASDDPEVRYNAYGSLSSRNDAPAALVGPLVVRGLGDEVAQVRETCAWLAVAMKTLPRDVARALLLRVQDPEEKIDTALACAEALNQHKRWLSEPLFSALLALQRAHPKNWEVLLRLGAHAPRHPEVVLRLWADSAARGHLRWQFVVAVLRELPARALEPYPDARQALANPHPR